MPLHICKGCKHWVPIHSKFGLKLATYGECPVEAEHRRATVGLTWARDGRLCQWWEHRDGREEAAVDSNGA